MSHSKSHHGTQSPATPAQTPASHPDSASAPAACIATTPTHDDIAQRAYDIYVENDCRKGQSERNWHQAEKDLRKQGAVACQAEHRKKEFFAPDAVA